MASGTSLSWDQQAEVTIRAARGTMNTTPRTSSFYDS
jgi:hypothetical protein